LAKSGELARGPILFVCAPILLRASWRKAAGAAAGEERITVRGFCTAGTLLVPKSTLPDTCAAALLVKVKAVTVSAKKTGVRKAQRVAEDAKFVLDK
jgi:hypothetical protein